MSRLDELIQELCPNGVEYRELGDIATISRGGNFQKKDYAEAGIPCIHYGQIYTYYGLFADETRKFLDNAFRDGEIKTAGTDIDKLMPPVSRFGGGGRAEKKQGVIEKLKIFFEKYFGIGASVSFTAKEEKKTAIYELKSYDKLSMAAEDITPYGEQN